jgi:hypothetical protein
LSAVRGVLVVGFILIAISSPVVGDWVA